MNTGKAGQGINGWVKLAAALVLLAGLLLGGILAAPGPSAAQALNAPQVIAPSAPVPIGVNGTLASFAALFPQLYTANLPFLMK